MIKFESSEDAASGHRGNRASDAGEATYLPLSDIRVVDLTTSYAGPIASMHLGDLGADVVKVERPVTGDDCRSWGPPFVDGHSAWFGSANHNKRSICLDIQTDDGRRVLDRLLVSAHVLIVNLSPPALRRLRLTPTEVQNRHPHLIYCSLSGFGLDGPDADLLGYDLIAQARSGLMSVTGESGGLPQRPSTALTDIVSGYVAVLAILSAIRMAERTGRGAALEVSLLDVALNLMGPRIAAYVAGEPEPKPSGATDSVLAVYQAFPAADGLIVVAIGNDSIWRRFCAAVDRPELGDDPRFLTNELRRTARGELTSLIQDIISRHDVNSWLERFRSAGVPSAPVQFLANVVHDPHVQSRRSIVSPPTGTAGSTRVETPWRIVGRHSRANDGVPALGEHGHAILCEAGFTEAEITRLQALGAIVVPEQSARSLSRYRSIVDSGDVIETAAE